MSNNNSYQPIFILPEDTKRTTGREAQRNNIAAAKAVAQTVRTTLGPKGMDKMIVDAAGDVIVTNDGVTILEEMQIEHPAAKMIVEIAKTQENIVGDGTTTAVVIAGELLKKAEDLLDQEIHPTVLAKGYRLAEVQAQQILKKLAEKVSLEHDSILKNIAITAMTGKGAETNKDFLAELILQAVKSVAVNGKFELNDVKVETIVGESVEKSELVQGLVLDKEKVHASMPQQIADGKVALLDASLEIKNTEIDAKIQITDPMQLNMFLDQEEKTLRNMVETIAATGATVLFCQKGIDDLAQHFLAKKGMFAVRRVKKSDMEKLSRATGGKIVSNWKELNIGDLGTAGLVREEKISDEEMIFVEKCSNAKTVTLLVRGGTSHVVEEIKRAVTDALGDIAAALRDGAVVPGAGATEMALAKELRKYAGTLKGREQLAVQAFAEAMEVIPRTLAENAGLDPIDVLTQLRAAHDNGQVRAGVNVFTGGVMDAWAEGVIEPLKVKTLALSSAAEVAEMILRIDDVIMGKKQEMPRGNMDMGM
ncbi:MAG: thermosome subunit [Candidatus Staskawiczbacteria bacterium RIFCSPHIGHO2_01_FULL_41_41]|uniref:Thermosome subunit n=1 Tax=Candidatus Staskawiczbacteria bacterium RIFCSPHIGHO2_01_FULL_41_41 TaxID=1802203 RepID=A0A1G2HVX2_9BACT|nr:MAG: thermosome subunit [Candidatus Staskawiczbacteria bacterium RIFCSPHIGHO2_01_FULL_41_41]HLD79557.1 thermosome subunit alpha [Candidatus Nanoarchaeia archaeon]